MANESGETDITLIPLPSAIPGRRERREWIERSGDSATIYSKPWQPNRHEVPVKLCETSESTFFFGFLCANVDDAAAEIESRGVELRNTPFGPAVEDPEGNVVTLYNVRDAECA